MCALLPTAIATAENLPDSDPAPFFCSPSAPTALWPSLQASISSTASLLLPGSAAFAASTLQWNNLIEYSPLAVLFAACEGDVQAAVRLASAANVCVVARSSGEQLCVQPLPLPSPMLGHFMDPLYFPYVIVLQVTRTPRCRCSTADWWLMYPA